MCIFIQLIYANTAIRPVGSLHTPHESSRGQKGVQPMKKVIVLLGVLIAVSQVHAAGCTDFSGNWKGLCTASNGQTSPSTVVIAQSACGGVSVNGNYSAIPGAATTYAASQDLNSVLT